MLVVNNFCTALAWEQVRRRAMPNHVLFGVDYLADHGYGVRSAPFRGTAALRALGHVLRKIRFPIPLGNIERQAAAWRWLNEADLIYVPCGNEVTALNYLRTLGVVRIPIVVLQHHSLNYGRLARARAPFVRWQVRGTDAFATLSERVAADINKMVNPGTARARAVCWGPDPDFYPRANGPGRGVVAAGRTGRDFATFGLAASRASVPAQIFCLNSDVGPEFVKFNSNVRVTTPGPGCEFDYPTMLPHLAAARVIAVPLHAHPASLAGLTSMMDALALGRPMIVTRHPLIDLDIEALGIGRWVEPGDVEGWLEAMRWFDAHPDESEEMGRRARRLVDDGLNSATFARELVGVFEKAGAARTA